MTILVLTLLDTSLAIDAHIAAPPSPIAAGIAPPNEIIGIIPHAIMNIHAQEGNAEGNAGFPVPTEYPLTVRS